MKLNIAPNSAHPDVIELSPGEVHFLWWFIQGSIMNPDTRKRLRKAWGFCERHAWGWMAVEATFRTGYMHGPAVLYEDLMERAVRFFEVSGPAQNTRVRRNLREKGLCLMCEEGYGPDSRGFVKPEIVEQGRDLTQLRLMAQRTFPYWSEAVCGQCDGSGSTERCRKHLLKEAHGGSMKGFHAQKALVEDIYRHLTIFSRSFWWEFRGTQTEEGEASLISAVGWFSGWKPLLSIVDRSREVSG
jgi:hypothetical protein